MEGLPVVILQSCDSLDERVLWRIDELGGVALVGSVTPIHSGSGSGLVKALSDAVLYRGATLGEALRDAQNYLFCLEDLKTRRGQKEQAKSRRVALSFRLWGDPGVARAAGGRRGRRSARRWPCAPSGPDELVIEVPRRRLPEARNGKYYARMFPGSQPAGMVKQPKREAARQVTPVYFFRVPLPADFAADGELLAGPGGQTNQATCRVDATGRSLYVLFFPELERPGETIVLRRSDSGTRRRGDWGGTGLDRETSRPAGGHPARAAGGDVRLRADHVPRAGADGARATPSGSLPTRPASMPARPRPRCDSPSPSTPSTFASATTRSSLRASSAKRLEIGRRPRARHRGRDAEDGRVPGRGPERHSLEPSGRDGGKICPKPI